MSSPEIKQPKDITYQEAFAEEDQDRDRDLWQHCVRVLRGQVAVRKMEKKASKYSGSNEKSAG